MIYLTAGFENREEVKAAGAIWDGEARKWVIEDYQKSDPAFAKYLPKENKNSTDFEPNPDWAGDTEKQIFGSMNSEIPNPFNHIKTYTDPEPKKEEGSRDPSSPEILEPVITESSRDLSAPEKPTKRTRGQIIDAEDSKIKKTYALSLDAISRCDRISKHFHMNLSSTIEKALMIAEQWIEDNAKDMEIQKINNQNDQLISAIQKTISNLETQIKEQNREIDALKNASTKNIGTDIKTTNNQDYQKFEERIDKKLHDSLKKMDANAKALTGWTQNLINQLNDRTGPMQMYFNEKGGWSKYESKWQEYKNSKQIAEALKEGGE